MKEIKLFLIGFIIILCFSIFSKEYLLPVDILGNLPLFNEKYNSSPKNSLLADPVFQFEPWRHLAKEKILKGEFPLWNENNGRGAPFFANPQTAILYPLNYIYYFSPEKFALTFIPLLKMLLFILFSYLYFKSLILNKAIPFISSFIVATSGFFILWLLWPHTNVFLLLPLILYLTEKISQAGSSYRWHIALSFIYFIAVLGGHPETLAEILILHLFYLMFKFKKEKKRYIQFFSSISLGFLLGAIQLIPFFEYLLNSFTLDQRGAQMSDFYLPKISFIMNFFPFILGAPHKEFYKPISEFTNFQETAGGYVGLITILTAIFGSVKWTKDSRIKFWSFVVLFSWLVSYQIWPVNLLLNLPLFSILASHRMIGVAGFGLVVLFALSADKLLSQRIPKKLIKNLNFILIAVFVLTIAINLALLIIPLNLPEKVNRFLPFLQTYGSIVSISTVIFLILFIHFQSKLTRVKVLILLILILFQTFFLFYGYNPSVSDNSYYPSTKIIDRLQSIDKGTILNVGNPIMPANINLIYNLKNIQNNDAIEILNYRKEFDDTFNKKNIWKEIDEVKYESAQKFGISYILSDYNINLKKEKIQPDKEIITSLSDPKNPLKNSFKFKESYLYGIRFLTANYNRKNNCEINVQIYNQTTQKNLGEDVILCSEVKDLMFYTVDFSGIKLENNNKYLISIYPKNVSEDNFVGLWSDQDRKPYFEILYKDDLTQKDRFELISFDSNIYLWKVSNSANIKTLGNIQKQSSSSTSISFEVDMPQTDTVEIKIPYYPGWTALVDNKKVEITNSNPFMLIKVPKGYHYVELRYQPLSFILGLLITSLALISIAIYVVKKEFKSGQCNRLVKYCQNINSKYSWIYHLKVLFSGFLASVISLLLIIKVIDFRFVTPHTTSINWLTVYSYPKQQDYFYFFFCLIYLYVATLLFWIIWIWKKNE